MPAQKNETNPHFSSQSVIQNLFLLISRDVTQINL